MAAIIVESTAFSGCSYVVVRALVTYDELAEKIVCAVSIRVVPRRMGFFEFLLNRSNKFFSMIVG